MPEAGTPPLSVAEIVSRLDQAVIGQLAAKRAMATALHHRALRRALSGGRRGCQDHLLMIGPAGVGRTEIVQAAAEALEAPFLKIDASRLLAASAAVDGEKLVCDLVEAAARQQADAMRAAAEAQARSRAEDRLIDALLPKRRGPGFAIDISTDSEQVRRRLRAELRAGDLNDRQVEIDVTVRAGHELGHAELAGAGARVRRQTVTVAEILPQLVEEQLGALVNEDHVARQALADCEHRGIVLIADLDRLVARGDADDIRREAVQRDLLSLMEGRTIGTRFGALRTEQLLVIGAGVFRTVRPGQLIPELQGRFSLRVELGALGHDELREILAEPDAGLAAQYVALFAASGGELRFATGAIERLAEIAVALNARDGDIGAHRLPILMARLLGECAPDARLDVDVGFVDAVFDPLLEDTGTGGRLL